MDGKRLFLHDILSRSLIMLARSPGTPVSSRALAGIYRYNRPTRHTIHVRMSRLRAMLGPSSIAMSRNDGYRLTMPVSLV